MADGEWPGTISGFFQIRPGGRMTADDKRFIVPSADIHLNMVCLALTTAAGIPPVR